jgi:hypothetical protein
MLLSLSNNGLIYARNIKEQQSVILHHMCEVLGSNLDQD